MRRCERAAASRDAPERASRRPKGWLDVAFVPGVPVVPECDVEQLRTERVFVAVPDGIRGTLCGKDAIEWSMLRGEEPIVCQSDAVYKGAGAAASRFETVAAASRFGSLAGQRRGDPAAGLLFSMCRRLP